MPRQEIFEGKAPKFDLRTTIREPKTGKVLKEQPYTRYVSLEFGEFYSDPNGFYDPCGNDILDPRVKKPEIIVPVSITKK